MPLSPLEYLRHIQDEGEYLAARMKGMSKEKFVQDEAVKQKALEAERVYLRPSACICGCV